MITVLGASGFLGSAVSAALARRPGRLRLVGRGPCHVPADAVPTVELCLGLDLTDRASLAAAVAGSEVIVHLVSNSGGWRIARDVPEHERVNTGVMRDLLEVVGGGPPVTILFAGSTAQVGVPDRLPIDGTEPDRPATPYARQKQAAERLLLGAHDGVRGVSLRVPGITGAVPGAHVADRGILAVMARRALADQGLEVWGEVTRDYLDVQDVADAFVAALAHIPDLAGRHWVLGSGTGTTLRTAFEIISARVARETGRPPVPVQDVPAPPDVTATDLHSVRVDPVAFHAVTGWTPRIPLHHSLAAMVGQIAGSLERTP